MWTDCPQVHDKPVQRWGFALEDLMVLGGVCCGLMVFLPLLPWVMATVGLFGGAYYGKRGKPPGAIVHWFQEHQLIPWIECSLPGFIPAREQTYSPW